MNRRLNVNRRLLELAEYISLGFSFTGLVAAAVSQQIAYAAVPLMMNLPLSLINRYRMEQSAISALSVSQNAEIQNIRHQVTTLTNQLDPRPEPQELLNLRAQLQSLSQQFQNRNEPQAIAQITRTLGNLRHEFNNRTEIQVVPLLNEQLGTLMQLVSSLEIPEPTDLSEMESAISSIHNQLSRLTDQFNNLVIPEPIDINLLNQHFTEIANGLNSALGNQYELVFQPSGTQQVLRDALSQSRERLIIVSPWLRQTAVNPLRQDVESCLDRGVQILIGFGYSPDIGRSIILSADGSRSYRPSQDPEENYSALTYLIGLNNRERTNRISLQPFPEGTHEKFLVCDRSFAMVCSHNLLGSGSHGQWREIGLKIYDQNIIAELIERFDNHASHPTPRPPTWSSSNVQQRVAGF